MKTYWRVFFVGFLLLAGLGMSDVRAQEGDVEPAVLRIHQKQTTSQTGFPTYLAMYHVLDGAKSSAEALALTGTISVKNDDPRFSEVLWLLVYWQGECPAHDLSLTGASILWSDIVKNPADSESEFSVNLEFAQPLPMSGCVGLYYGGGPLFAGKVTMSADLKLRYRSTRSNSNTVLDLSGEYCFGQDWGCQNATSIDGEAFAVPVTMPAGHLLELFGNISDSTFDGSKDFGPLPAGKSWSAVNEFYLLPGGCGVFAENLNSQGFPNPVPLATLNKWLPGDALHLASIPLVDRISSEETGKATLQGKVESIFSVPVTVNAGDCIVVIYGRKGNGATDNETQVHALMAP